MEKLAFLLHKKMHDGDRILKHMAMMAAPSAGAAIGTYRLRSDDETKNSGRGALDQALLGAGGAALGGWSGEQFARNTENGIPRLLSLKARRGLGGPDAQAIEELYSAAKKSYLKKALGMTALPVAAAAGAGYALTSDKASELLKGYFHQESQK